MSALDVAFQDVASTVTGPILTDSSTVVSALIGIALLLVGLHYLLVAFGIRSDDEPDEDLDDDD